MPLTGGASDKIGNRYEGLWAIDQLLKVVEGSLLELVLEPVDEDESRGIEFKVVRSDNITEYWTIKRQISSLQGWSLSKLAESDRRGRSILGDLFSHVNGKPKNRGIFASTQAARDLNELTEYSGDPDVFFQRVRRAEKSLGAQFRQHIVPLCDGDEERAQDCLSRTRIYSMDERSLKKAIEVDIRTLFYRVDGELIDAESVRGYLSIFLSESIHSKINRRKILDALELKGMRWRDWSRDRFVRDRIGDLSDTYIRHVHSDLIGGTFLVLPGIDSIITPHGEPPSKRILVSGEAGCGKSCSLAALVSREKDVDVPVLPIRFDSLVEGILSTVELGKKLGLSESPAVVLAGIANGGKCVLVLDQLDAVSLASGRRTELWELFESLSNEADRYPNMSLVVGCRAFDLEHDDRLRTLKRDASQYTLVNLRSLSHEKVEEILVGLEIKPSDLGDSLMTILQLPLHMSMFLSLSVDIRRDVIGIETLFKKFWQDKKQKIARRLGRASRWAQVIDTLSAWLSDNQDLSAPQHVLDDFDEDALAMVSEHVLVCTDGRYKFFHESFFDYSFARRFATGNRRLADVLCSSEQHLFRRAQTRQILSYLRDADFTRYLTELESVLMSEKIRFHIKQIVLGWLRLQKHPQKDEWAILKSFRQSNLKYRSHVRAIWSGSSDWFQILDDENFFDEALSCDENERIDEVIWYLRSKETLEVFSDRVAELLEKHKKPESEWNSRLYWVFQYGGIYHGRQLFDLFLRAIREGMYDPEHFDKSSGSAWWGVFYSSSRKNYERDCEVLGCWLTRIYSVWKKTSFPEKDIQQQSTVAARLDSNTRFERFLNDTGHGVSAVREAATNAPEAFARNILPIVAQISLDLAQPDDDESRYGYIWGYRSFGDDPLDVSDAILVGTAKALETLAAEAPGSLDEITKPFLKYSRESLSFLFLRAWTSAPKTYADRIVSYILDNPSRLQIGYNHYCLEGGDAHLYVSGKAISAASKLCSDERFNSLEGEITNLRIEYEKKYPQHRGRRQLELLMRLEITRLGARTKQILDELKRKFPDFSLVEPRRGEARFIGSPITSEAAEKMSDEQWLRALEKYAGTGVGSNAEKPYKGGESQLGQSLTSNVKKDPERFVRLALNMSATLPATYFEAILHGLADSHSEDNNESPNPMTDLVHRLIIRVHGLPNRPCGRMIAWLVRKWHNFDWSDQVLEIVSWYAENDPDPVPENSRKSEQGDQTDDERNPHSFEIMNI